MERDVRAEPSGPVSYRSTRAARDDACVTFETALLQGLAPDGGLYLPSTVPALPARWAEATSLADLALRLLPPFLGERASALEGPLEDALDLRVPVVEVAEGTFVLELFHGPTLAFKDVGARTMARLMERAVQRRGGRLTVLVATSGDTGSAVADAFSGLDAIRVALLYPDGLVSDVQERQLVAARPGVQAFAVRGDFDACQRLVKGAFADARLSHLGLTSANSINIGRLLPQALYYVWGYLQVARTLGWDLGSAPGPACVAAVPSGNLGNLTGGVLAALMGLPLRRFVAAHNANDFFPDYLRGDAERYAFRPTIATLSNAMDVGAPSNFERLVTLLNDDLPRWVWGVSVDDATTLARMGATLARDGYLACPHTAVALEGLERFRAATHERAPALVLATAHPAKFPDAVARATGAPPPRAAALDDLVGGPTRVEPLEADSAALAAALLALA